MIRILKEPVEKTYKALIDTAFSKCTEFSLVERHQNQLNEIGAKILEKLKSEIVDIEVDEQWPGTKLDGHFANIYFIKTSEKAKKIIMENIKSLYGWLSPDYPEDLTFYSEKGVVWLQSTSHERTCYIDDCNSGIFDELLEIGLKCEIYN